MTASAGDAAAASPLPTIPICIEASIELAPSPINTATGQLHRTHLPTGMLLWQCPHTQTCVDPCSPASSARCRAWHITGHITGGVAHYKGIKGVWHIIGYTKGIRVCGTLQGILRG